MKILKLNLDQANRTAIIREAVRVFQNGGLVIYPTETVYGLGAAAANSAAIDKLLRYKGRREGKPLSIAVADQQMAERYVEINEQAAKFYKNFLPGPFTVISKSKNLVDSRVNSEFGTLGIRIPDYPLMIDIIKTFGQAITSTSANISNQKRPYKIQDIFDHLQAKQKALIDLVIDAGELPKNEPSIVIDTTLSTPIALRGSLDQNQQNTGTGQIWWSQSQDETSALANRLMLNHLNQLHKTGLIFALNGPLGIGKTIFAKGVAKFLGIQTIINSPSYSYMNEYAYQRAQTKGIFYHLDAWKIDSQAEVELLAINQLIKKNNVLVVEWFDQIKPWLKLNTNCTIITLDFAESKQKRKIIISEN